MVRTSAGRQPVVSLDKSNISWPSGVTPHTKERTDYIHLSVEYRIER